MYRDQKTALRNVAPIGSSRGKTLISRGGGPNGNNKLRDAMPELGLGNAWNMSVSRELGLLPVLEHVSQH